MGRVFVAGAGMSSFGPMPDADPHELASAAILDAIADAGVEADRLEAAFGASVAHRPSFGQKALVRLGLDGLPVVNVENACASGSTAVHCLYQLIACGAVAAGVAFGAERQTRPGGGVLPVSDDDLEGAVGRTMPAAFAMCAQLHMERYGTTHAQMAAVAVKNRRNAVDNPKCHMRQALTIDDVLSSPLIADPLTRNSCCPISDGAGAIVLVNELIARHLPRAPVELVASVLVSGRRTPFGIVAHSSPMSVEAAARAYRAAGLRPVDVDVCELHDPFTIAEIIHYEDLGFCAPGSGGRFVESGAADLDGEVAVSPSGGLLAKGHPLGATGLAQVYEMVVQLRGNAGSRQVDGARVGLTHLVGGGVAKLESAACTVQIYRT